MQNSNSSGRKVKVWKITLHDPVTDKEVDVFYSKGEPFALGPGRYRFIERGTGVEVTVEGNVKLSRVEITE